MNITKYLCTILDNKYFLDEVLILGPYPTAKFIKKFFGDYYPKRTPTTGPEITLIIDDGWDQQRIEEIEESIPNGPGIRQPHTTIHRVAANNLRGLVHAKLYYFQASNRDKNYTKRFLLVGSANASEMGFGVHAETYINIDLADIAREERTAIGQYIKSLKAKESIAEPCKFSLGRNTWVQLPAVNFVEDQESGFDAWLRRGRLCHKYQSDQNFGKIKLHLKKPLPTSIFEQVLKSSRFGQEQNSSVLSRSYINEIVDDDNDSDPLWRSKFFVDTYYGH